MSASQLPPELLELVLDNLTVADIKNLRCTDRRLHDLCTIRLWKHLVVICGLQTSQAYRSTGYVPAKIFSRTGTLTIDVCNIAKFVQDVPTMPAVMAAFSTLTLVQFHTIKRQTTFGSNSTYSAEKQGLVWLADNLHTLTAFKSTKCHCEPLDSPLISRFRRAFPTMRMKYTILPLREYYDDVPTAHTISVFWSAETAHVPLNATFVSPALTKVIFRQDDGVTSAPYDVKFVKDTFANCANLAKMVIQVKLVDQFRTADWIPRSVRNLHLLAEYDSQTEVCAKHVQNVTVCDSSKGAMTNLSFGSNVMIDIL